MSLKSTSSALLSSSFEGSNGYGTLENSFHLDRSSGESRTSESRTSESRTSRTCRTASDSANSTSSCKFESSVDIPDQGDQAVSFRNVNVTEPSDVVCAYYKSDEKTPLIKKWSVV